MALGRRKVSVRREPVFDSGPSQAELRVRPEDRPAPRATPGRKRRRPKGGEDTPPARKRHGGGGRRGPFGRFVYWTAVFLLWIAVAGIAGMAWIGVRLPAIQSLEIPKRPPSIQIAGMDGTPLVNRGEMGASVPLKELPNYLPQAFIAIEDRRFHSHYGIDPIGIARAASANIMRRGVHQGGSTITQQLAKNLFLTQERTLERKLQELVLALWLERKLTKPQIIEHYLNRVYFGAGAYGVEAAAQRYFNKSARQITLSEAALLAGLVRSPSRLAPTRNYEAAERRGQTVLIAMVQSGFITDPMAQTAMSRPPRIAQNAAGGAANYVADWVMDVLNDLVGRVEQDIVVRTSIDPALQAAAEKALTDELAQKGARFGVGQGAIVAMSPDGAVRAMVGGRNYAESQFNRAVAAKRQPGSAFKPFVYLTALERGLTPDTMREDRPIDVRGWRPENYTREYFGPVTLTQALAMSLNTVSVRLTLEVGPSAIVRTAHRLGIASKLEPNPSIALGTSEVSLVELVSAFGTFANGGHAVVPHVVQRVRTADGKTLFQRAPHHLGRIVEPRNVGMMNEMMQETLLRGTARRGELPGRPAAGKTGTSQDFRDAWFVGYTAHLVTGVWLGNDDNSPTKKATGGGLPVDVWARFMRIAHQGVPVAALPGATRGTPLAGPLLPPASIPGPVPTGTSPAPQPPPQGGGIDTWLIDRLFGRR